MANKDHNTRVPRPAHNYVPEYQQSGIPFVKEVTLTGNADDVEFDFVTRWIIVKNPAGNNEVKLGFNSEAGIGVNATAWYSLLGNLNQTAADGFTRLSVETPRLEVKCKKICLKGTNAQKVYVIAGLTNIRSLDFPDQTAANGFTGVE
jgi:hypothetical protein